MTAKTWTKLLQEELKSQGLVTLTSRGNGYAFLTWRSPAGLLCTIKASPYWVPGLVRIKVNCEATPEQFPASDASAQRLGFVSRWASQLCRCKLESELTVLESELPRLLTLCQQLGEGTPPVSGAPCFARVPTDYCFSLAALPVWETACRQEFGRAA